MKKSISITVKVVIFLVATTGFLTFASIAPNILQTVPFLKRFFNQKTPKRQINFTLRKASLDLIKNNYIQKKGSKFELTKKGELILMKISPDLIKRPKWDGRWRVVSFDVREESRIKRDVFRNELKTLGFIQMQRSVWISPYPCEQYIELLKAEHGFGKNMRYMIVSHLSDDEKLKNYFKIKNV